MLYNRMSWDCDIHPCLLVSHPPPRRKDWTVRGRWRWGNAFPQGGCVLVKSFPWRRLWAYFTVTTFPSP